MPATRAMSIVAGPLRGTKWVVGSGPHSCWLGLYESLKQRRFVEIVRSGDCVIDVGANAGFYTLLASRLVGPMGRVVAFEPLPFNQVLLRRHLELNQVTNAIVFQEAVSDHEGKVRFKSSGSHLMGHICDDGELEVETVTLDRLWERDGLAPPQVIKIDAEGAETAVLRGAQSLLSRFRPTIILAAHCSSRQEECVRFLQAEGYEIFIDRDGSRDGMWEAVAKPANN